MASDVIRSGEINLVHHRVLYLTVTSDALTITSTAGYLTIDCLHPRYILRDCMAGQPLDFRSGASGGPFDAGLSAVVLSQHQPRQHRAQPLADSVPVRDGWCIVELATRTDYHPWPSLQIIAIDRSRHLILGFSTFTYLISVSPGANVRSAFNLITDGGKSCHCTIHPPAAFFDWLPSRRFHFERIQEISDKPETLGGFIAVADFRDIPEHAAFAAEAAKIVGRSGPGIDL
jgi:hypothetical protein